MGPSRSSSLPIGGDSSAVAGSGRTGGASDRSAVVELRNAPGAPPFPLDKGKGRVNLIKYHGGSEYLKSAVQHALTVGPSKVGPSYGATFARRYRPPFGVRVWSPDFLTFYVVFMPKMVCFFEVAFDNGLRFPLHPFIKGVLQHFNVFPSQLLPNDWGILVGLLVFFRDREFGVPSIALFLYLFSTKETAESFLYFSRRSDAPLVISDLPSSHRLWKGRYFFVSGRNWEYDPFDKDDTLGVPVAWSTPENLRKCSLCFWYNLYGVIGISDSTLSTFLSGARIDLSAKDNVIALALAECPPRPYAELIKSDIPGPSSLRSARSAVLRPSPPSTMKISLIGPSAAKPTKGELLVRLETLSRKPRSVKRKTLDFVEKDRLALVKVPKLGASSSSPFTHVQKPEQALSPPAEVLKVLSSQPRPGSVAKAKGPSGKAVEQPLAIMPITVWNPPAKSVRSPSSKAEELKSKDFETGRDGDSLLLDAELAAGAVSSILKDSDLKRSSMLPVDEALALSLQGVASVIFHTLSCLISILAKY